MLPRSSLSKKASVRQVQAQGPTREASPGKAETDDSDTSSRLNTAGSDGSTGLSGSRANSPGYGTGSDSLGGNQLQDPPALGLTGSADEAQYDTEGVVPVGEDLTGGEGGVEDADASTSYAKQYLLKAKSQADMEIVAKESALQAKRDKNERLRTNHFRKKFDEFNEPGATSVDFQKMNQIFLDMGMKFDKYEMKKMFEKFDHDGSGSIDFDEFSAMFSALNKKRFQVVFNEFDVDGSGELDPDEVLQAFQTLGYEFTSKQVADMIQEYDASGDEKIQLDEFCEMLEGTLIAEEAEEEDAEIEVDEHPWGRTWGVEVDPQPYDADEEGGRLAWAVVAQVGWKEDDLEEENDPDKIELPSKIPTAFLRSDGCQYLGPLGGVVVARGWQSKHVQARTVHWGYPEEKSWKTGGFATGNEVALLPSTSIVRHRQEGPSVDVVTLPDASLSCVPLGDYAEALSKNESEGDHGLMPVTTSERLVVEDETPAVEGDAGEAWDDPVLQQLAAESKVESSVQDEGGIAVFDERKQLHSAGGREFGSGGGSPAAAEDAAIAGGEVGAEASGEEGAAERAASPKEGKRGGSVGARSGSVGKGGSRGRLDAGSGKGRLSPGSSKGRRGSLSRAREEEAKPKKAEDGGIRASLKYVKMKERLADLEVKRDRIGLKLMEEREQALLMRQISKMDAQAEALIEAARVKAAEEAAWRPKGTVSWSLKVDEVAEGGLGIRLGVVHTSVEAGADWADYTTCNNKTFWWNSYSGAMFVGDVLVPHSGNCQSMSIIDQWAPSRTKPLMGVPWGKGDELTVTLDLGEAEVSFRKNGVETPHRIRGLWGEVRVGVQLTGIGDTVVMVETDEERGARIEARKEEERRKREEQRKRREERRKAALSKLGLV